MLERALPDITSDSNSDVSALLQWVGMESIAVPLTLKMRDGSLQTPPAKANVYVSLDSPNAKGIHMSRLYRLINELAECDCSPSRIEQLLDAMIRSQNGIGHSAKLELTFDLMIKKPALLSQESGFQDYPVTLKAEKGPQGLSFELELTIPYSSTCPCSASLARQLVAEAIQDTFPTETLEAAGLIDWIKSPAGSVATPHSQRSYAYLRLGLGDNAWPDLADLIVQFESIIGTPVQTAVKRVDEQEFARLNAENLMFCEDAGRRIKAALEDMSFVQNYWFKVEHQESLHAHNAVVIDQKSL